MNLFELITDAIKTVEEELGSGGGATKKEKVLNIISNFVDIPEIPEILEREILSIVIDLVVFVFNKYNLFMKNE